jgi:hypothetical protein
LRFYEGTLQNKEVLEFFGSFFFSFAGNNFETWLSKTRIRKGILVSRFAFGQTDGQSIRVSSQLDCQFGNAGICGSSAQGLSNSRAISTAYLFENTVKGASSNGFYL